jgi:hypothetical protein
VSSSGHELRGAVLDVLKALLANSKERDVVLAIVGRLVAESTQLARRLARLSSRFKKSEKISTAQLVLFLDAVRRGDGEPEAADKERLAPDELEEADQRLLGASGLDAPKPDDDPRKLRTGKPPRQPHARTPARSICGASTT